MSSATISSAAIALAVSLPCIAATARTEALPDFDSKKQWSVYTCNAGDECRVKIKTTITGAGCNIEIEDLIDRHKDYPNQTIVWDLDTDPPNYVIEFRDAGIKVTHGNSDMPKTSMKAKQSRGQIVGKNHRLLLYDIQLQYKHNNGKPVECTAKGPAIVNRG